MKTTVTLSQAESLLKMTNSNQTSSRFAWILVASTFLGAIFGYLVISPYMDKPPASDSVSAALGGGMGFLVTLLVFKLLRSTKDDK